MILSDMIVEISSILHRAFYEGLRGFIVYAPFILNIAQTNFTWICRFVYLLTINFVVVIVDKIVWL